MIPNIQRLKLNADDQQKLLHGARLHKQNSNIRFNVKRTTKAMVIITVAQGYHLSENYASAVILEERTRELFKEYVDGREIKIEATTYSPDEMGTIQVPFKYEKLRKIRAENIKYDNFHETEE